MYGKRNATTEEIHNWKKVNAILAKLEKEEDARVYWAIGDYAHAWGEERKTTYARLYRMGKKYGFTPKEAEDFYCIEWAN